MAVEDILIVDDNATNMKLMAFLLQSSGYQVRTATSAQEALAQIDTSLPRLILLDLQMPEMDGLTLTRKLRADARTANLIIVAVTAFAMKGDKNRAMEAGCDGYIAKPIDTRTLSHQVAEYLQHRPKTKETD